MTVKHAGVVRLELLQGRFTLFQGLCTLFQLPLLVADELFRLKLCLCGVFQLLLLLCTLCLAFLQLTVQALDVPGTLLQFAAQLVTGSNQFGAVDCAAR